MMNEIDKMVQELRTNFVYEEDTSTSGVVLLIAAIFLGILLVWILR